MLPIKNYLISRCRPSRNSKSAKNYENRAFTIEAPSFRIIVLPLSKRWTPSLLSSLGLKLFSLLLPIVRNSVQGSSTHWRAFGGKGCLCCCLSEVGLPDHLRDGVGPACTIPCCRPRVCSKCFQMLSNVISHWTAGHRGLFKTVILSFPVLILVR